MRVVVFGAGAVGSVLGARLYQAGHSVLLVARASHVAAIRERGLTVAGSFEGRFRPDAVSELSAPTAVDAVLLTVKSFDLATAGRAIARALPNPVPILALQNGLDVEGPLSEALRAEGWRSPEEAVVRGVNNLPATFVAAGEVRQAGEGDVALARSPPPALAAATELFAHLLSGAGVPVRRVDGLPREVWKKALVNAAVNPVTADFGFVNGRLLEEPWRGQALRLLLEALAVARSEGFDLSEEEAERELWKVVRATRENRSSMLQDVERSRPTEIEAISGAILARAAAKGLHLPHTARVVERIRAKTAARPG